MNNFLFNLNDFRLFNWNFHITRTLYWYFLNPFFNNNLGNNFRDNFHNFLNDWDLNNFLNFFNFLLHDINWFFNLLYNYSLFNDFFNNFFLYFNFFYIGFHILYWNLFNNFSCNVNRLLVNNSNWDWNLFNYILNFNFFFHYVNLLLNWSYLCFCLHNRLNVLDNFRYLYCFIKDSWFFVQNFNFKRLCLYCWRRYNVFFLDNFNCIRFRYDFTHNLLNLHNFFNRNNLLDDDLSSYFFWNLNDLFTYDFFENRHLYVFFNDCLNRN